MINVAQTVFTTDADSFTDMEKRNHTRHLCNDRSVMRLSVRPEFRQWNALLVDLSSGGIGLLLEDALEKGTVLAFELQAPRGKGTIGRIARVCHCRPRATPPGAPWLAPTSPVIKFFRGLFGLQQVPINRPAWLVGCEFDRNLEDRDVTQILERLKSTSGHA